jgi:aminoglycoside phosphotransferase (APT) family kinase protein
MAVAAARALGVDLEALVDIGGHSGETWGAGEHVLRVKATTALDRELAACAATFGVVPTAEVVDRVDLDGVSAVLVRRLRGVPAADLGDLSPAQARRRGEACGRLHHALAGVIAPAALPSADPNQAESETTSRLPKDRLLHLDLHPFNVLVGGGGEVTGVIDWANARAGPPSLDQARSFSILTLDPGVVKRRVDPRQAALADGWIEAGGLDGLPLAALAWACRFMLDDLAFRYNQHELAGVRAALATAERADRHGLDL